MEIKSFFIWIQFFFMELAWNYLLFNRTNKTINPSLYQNENNFTNRKKLNAIRS
jgi:hypothetical protein